MRKSVLVLLAVAVSITLLMLLGPSETARAIPSKTPHIHAPGKVPWSAAPLGDPNAIAHNHRSPRSFGGDSTQRDPYTAFAVWDNRHKRVDKMDPFDLGHGFIDEFSLGDAAKPRYCFDDSGLQGNFQPAEITAAKNLVIAAFDAWGAITSADPNLITGIAFFNVGSCANDHEIKVSWRAIAEAFGLTDMNATPAVTVEFDTLLSGPGGATQWSFEQDPANVPPDRYHFYTIALHETGHVVGLDGQADADDVMDEVNDFNKGCNGGPGKGQCFDVIDVDSIEGARDLYSIPVGSIDERPSNAKHSITIPLGDPPVDTKFNCELTGPTTIVRGAVGDSVSAGLPVPPGKPLPVPNNLDDIEAEIVFMQLTGNCQQLNPPGPLNIPVTMTVRAKASNPFLSSTGYIEEQNDPNFPAGPRDGIMSFPANSFFDVFVQINAIPPIGPPLILHNEVGVQMYCEITDPPGIPPVGCDYEAQNLPVDVFDETDINKVNPAGQLTNVAIHTLKPVGGFMTDLGSDQGETSFETPDSSGPNADVLAGIAGAVLAGGGSLGGGAWDARGGVR